MLKMRKFIVISGMMFALNVACTGCGSDKVSYVQADASASSDVSTADESSSMGEGDVAEDTADVGTVTGEKVTVETVGSISDGNAGGTQSDKLAVYVCGAVNVPGVYYFEPGDIKSVALEAAGGFAEGAADDYVNLAEKLQDGEKLYFPHEEEVESGEIKYSSLSGTTVTSSGDDSQQETASQGTSSGKVNINTADRTELMTLPGIGESKAELIVSYRESNGAFNTVEDIMNINGIKEGVYNKIKDYITVE